MLHLDNILVLESSRKLIRVKRKKNSFLSFWSSIPFLGLSLTSSLWKSMICWSSCKFIVPHFLYPYCTLQSFLSYILRQKCLIPGLNIFFFSPPQFCSPISMIFWFTWRVLPYSGFSTLSLLEHFSRITWLLPGSSLCKNKLEKK